MFDALRRLIPDTSSRTADGAADSGTDVPATDGGTAVSQQQLTAAYGDKADDKLLERTATQLSSTARGAASAGEIRETARAQAAAGVAPSTYAGGYEFAARAAVKEAFDALEAGASVTDARERALDGVSETMADLQQGLEAFDAATVTVNEVIKAVPMSAILIDANHEVIAYTGRLMGLDDDHSEFVGEDCRETIAVATYSDRQRAKTLADKVAAAPHTAHEEWDVERTDGANTLVDFPVYRDRSVSKNKDGVEKHIEFLAVPIFDDGGELKAVLELIEDATEDIQREQDMVSLIEEVSATLGAIGDGDLTARADWEDTNGVIEPGLCDLVEDVNRMAGSFEELINGVDEKTHELEASIDQLGDASDRIDRTVEAQNDSLAEIGTEMENVSATMEEVAANAKEVTEAATRARETVAEGVEAGEKARESTDAVVESTDDLVDTVEQLGERMDEVGEVVDIIADIADQTNILALNANIEAARAETDGDGFAVVADEVKTLASETRDHADEIADRIEEIQRQADDTIDGVERSAEQIAATGDEIRRALDSLAAISDEVENTVDGISEVADANDDQAVRIEEVTATVAEARERADDVAETTDAVVDAVEEQEAAVDDLSDRVAELR